MFHRLSVKFVAAAIAFALAGPVSAQPPPAGDDLGAKALFYNVQGDISSVPTASAARPSAPPAAPRPTSPKAPQEPVLALRGSVLLVGPDGGTREVKPSHEFRSGDRVKVAFTSNRAGYLYLITVGSSGGLQVLAPRPGDPAKVQPGFRYQYPASPTAYFRFDHQPGREEIWAVLSDEPLDAVNLGQGRVLAVKAAEPRLQAQAAAQIVDAAELLAGKDLVFEEDPQAAYTSIRPAVSGPDTASIKQHAVTLKMVLTHQPR